MYQELVPIDGYESVYKYIDDNFHAFIAIHSTKLGPALGGCRIRQYDSDDAALADVLYLSKGMTLKNAAAGLNYGGGKCVVNAPKPTREIMLKVGEIVADLGGSYITGEDVGTSVADIRITAEKTRHVLSLGAAGDPSPWTSLGVFQCIQAARKQEFLDESNLSVWVQGLGKVGWGLCEYLNKAGYKLYVSDIVHDRVDAAKKTFGAVRYRDQFDEIDIYAPCALGQVVTDNSVGKMPPIICGSANNQLANDDLAEKLQAADVLYCPDFIVNSGGVIAAAAELTGFDEQKVRDHIMSLGDVLLNCISIGEKDGKTPLWGAKQMAALRLGEAKCCLRK